MRHNKRSHRIKRRAKTQYELLREQQQKELDESRKRGSLVDFTQMKVGTLSFRNKPIEICPQCNENGERLKFGSYVHRGVIRTDGTFEPTVYHYPL